MKFVVQSTGVANRFSFVIPTPQRCLSSAAIITLQTLPLIGAVLKIVFASLRKCKTQKKTEQRAHRFFHNFSCARSFIRWIGFMK